METRIYPSGGTEFILVLCRVHISAETIRGVSKVCTQPLTRKQYKYDTLNLSEWVNKLREE